MNAEVTQWILKQLADGKISQREADRVLRKPTAARGVPKAELRRRAALRRENEAKLARAGCAELSSPCGAASLPVAAKPAPARVSDGYVVNAVSAGVLQNSAASALCGMRVEQFSEDWKAGFAASVFGHPYRPAGHIFAEYEAGWFDAKRTRASLVA